jgi:protein-S-isoprenylcysteine O-methyltransferase Ste14
MDGNLSERTLNPLMLLRHLAGIVALPVTVIIILPLALASLSLCVPFWGIPYPSVMFLLVAGVVLTGVGFVLLYSTISLFIKRGKGTIAPWDPPKKLIVTGIYVHVRNPMHIGGVSDFDWRSHHPRFCIDSHLDAAVYSR